MADLLDRIEPTAGAWVPKVRAGTIQASIVGEIQVDADYAPVIEFEPSIVERVSNLGAKLSIDFYWRPTESQPSA